MADAGYASVRRQNITGAADICREGEQHKAQSHRSISAVTGCPAEAEPAHARWVLHVHRRDHGPRDREYAMLRVQCWAQPPLGRSGSSCNFCPCPYHTTMTGRLGPPCATPVTMPGWPVHSGLELVYWCARSTCLSDTDSSPNMSAHTHSITGGGSPQVALRTPPCLSPRVQYVGMQKRRRIFQHI